MPKGDNKPWPWIELEAEWMGTKPHEFPTVSSFLIPKGIPQNTLEKHTVGWREKRDSLLQRAADKAVQNIEKAAGSLIEDQGRKLAALLNLTFDSFLVIEKKGKNKGKPVEPWQLRSDLPDEIKARLFAGSAMLQQRLLGLQLAATQKVLGNAAYKAGFGGGEDGAGSAGMISDNAKILSIIKSPEARKAAQRLMDEIGGPVLDVGNDK